MTKSDMYCDVRSIPHAGDHRPFPPHFFLHNTNKMFKLGIIGAGRLGSFHANKAAAHADIHFLGVYDPVPDSAAALAQKHQVRAFETLESLLTETEAVVIATPTVSHHRVGMECLARGQHVLMEKPLATTSNEARELVETAQCTKRILQVGHVERFNPAWQAADLVLSLLKTEPAVIEATRTSGYTFRSTDIGTVLDMMIHDLDLVLSVVRSPIQSVAACGFHQIDPSGQSGHEDTAQARITFENGTVANFFASRTAPEAVRFMKITTRFRSANIDFGTGKTRLIRADGNVMHGEFAPKNTDSARMARLAPTFMKEHFHVEEIASASADALKLEMDDFVLAMKRNKQPKVPGREAMNAIFAAEAILTEIRKPQPTTQRRVA